MCGIAGVVRLAGGPSAEGAPLAAMCRTLVHRGPDDIGMHVTPDVALGMRRLAVIDVAGGRQPYRNEDGTVYCVFNGEIYNYRQLASGLRSRGHCLRSGADGEVIVHLWEEHGEEFLVHLNGMFAIALFDARTGQAVLARDRMGIKPLYVTETGGWLVFGSEIKAVLASGVATGGIDPVAVNEFLAWEYVPAPRTLLRGIEKLRPAELLRVSSSGVASRRSIWWSLPAGAAARDAGLTDDDWLDALDDRIATAVRRQMVSDVPVGAFLSGGVDSSLIVTAMGSSARTFSIGFDDPSYNEAAWAERVAGHLGTRHTTEIIEPNVTELFDDLMHFMDDPIADFSIFPTYLVSRVAREHVTVVLTGDGGDELFGGYETYQAQRLARRWSRLPMAVRAAASAAASAVRPRPEKKGLVNMAKRFLEGADRAPELEHARWRCFVDGWLADRLLVPGVSRAHTAEPATHILELFQEAGGRPPLDRQLYVDMKSYLAENCLVKVDRMSMACSLEARVPLLDHEVVELAFRLPEHLKLRPRITKPGLKRVAARHVPADCVYRPKQGFSVPIKHWLGGALRPRLEELLEPGAIRAEGMFDAPTVERLKQEHLGGRANHSHVLWGLMVFQEWKRRWA